MAHSGRGDAKFAHDLASLSHLGLATLLASSAMTSPILDSLPAIHTTVIGFGGAFFSAFAIYAYQKLDEARDKFESTREELDIWSTPTAAISPNFNLLTENGELNWDGHATTKLFQISLLLKERLGHARTELSDEEIIDACQYLCSILYLTFTSYPLTGIPLIKINGITDAMEKRRNAPLDFNRLNEIERRVTFLSWLWSSNRESLIELAKRGTQAERQATFLREKRIFESNTSTMPAGPNNDKEYIWNIYHKPKIEAQIDYFSIFLDYFGRLDIYTNKLHPILSKSLYTLNLYNKQFKIRKLSLWMISITLFMLTFGVFLPPVIQSAKIDFCLDWPHATDYILLTLTASPYFIICLWLYRKVKALKFL